MGGRKKRGRVGGRERERGGRREGCTEGRKDRVSTRKRERERGGGGGGRERRGREGRKEGYPRIASVSFDT